MSTFLHSAFVIIICALITFALRALPFIIFRGREVPKSVSYLGNVLPMAIMMTLIIYCLKDISFESTSGCLPQLISCGVTAGLHLWRRNALISIFGGTICCMLLTQLVFI